MDGDGNVYVLGFSSSTSTSATTLTIGSEQFSGAATPSGVTQYSVLFKLDTSFAVLWAKQIGGAESKSQVRQPRGLLDRRGLGAAAQLHPGHASCPYTFKGLVALLALSHLVWWWAFSGV